MKSIPKCGSITTLWATLVAEELFRLGVKHVCIAPGSRNTPLIAAIAKHPNLEKVVCQDERSAAFFALGCGRAARQPAVVLSTSGSAVANMWPAVVEAAADRVPLIVVTADRPPELRNVGANQTIDQAKIFGNYTRFYADMPVPDESVPLRYLLSTLDEAHASANDGPVHLNFMFREPFGPDVTENWKSKILEPISGWLQSSSSLVRYLSSDLMSDIAQIAQMMKHSENGIIVAGAINDIEGEKAVLELAEKIGWPLIPDILSNLRFTLSPAVANFADLALLDDDIRVPDVVIQFGGRLVSKRLQQFLDKGLSRSHVFVDDHVQRLDPGCVVTHRVRAKASRFAQKLSQAVEPRVVHTEGWIARSEKIRTTLSDARVDSELSEISVARALLRTIDDSFFLFSASSMPIRDLNMFGEPRKNPARVFANRGASGIDGIVSTACGVAQVLNRRGVLFSGDLTFVYDTNGLQLLKNVRNPLAIVVVNNRGGGIFTMLDIHKQREIFTPYFDAEHDVNLSGLCEAHSVRHIAVRDLEQWQSALREIPILNEHCVIEVASDKWENKRIHDELRDLIRERLN